MQKKRAKKKLIAKIISSLFIFIVLFVFFIVIQSAGWYLDQFEGVELSVAIYQIMSPLKGTSTTVLWEYACACVFPALFISIVLLFLYRCYDAVLDRLYFDIHVQTYHYLTNSYKDHFVLLGKKFKKVSKVIIFLALALAIVTTFWKTAVQVKLPEYVEQISSSSELIETYYVDPDKVAVSFSEKKRNLILIYIESMENTYASVEDGGGESINYIPELTRLAKEGVNFSNTDSLGGTYVLGGTSWTIAALLAYQTGVPYKLPIDSLDDDQEFLPGLKGMGEILQENGYHNYYMCGSDTTYGGRRNLFTKHGNYTVYDWLTAKEEGFIPDDYYVFWGMEDAKLYEYAKMHLADIAASGPPFNLNILTVDTHFPNGYLCELCEDEYEDQYANVVACASRQAYEFVEWAKEQEWYDDTTIVIVGDHLSMNEEFFANIDEFDRRAYNCFINLPQNMEVGQINNREFNAMDLFPTILASIGADIPGERLGLGTNLFSGEQTLQEKVGTWGLNSELAMYSNFYFDQFVFDNTATKQSSNNLKVLIVGDSIGEGAGAGDPSLKWYKYLIPYMKDAYDVNLDITNVSMGGNSSYAGYVRVMQLDDEEDYDLAVVCYGENDKPENFSLYYESILRAICNKFPSCKLMTILESSQRDYTEKIRTIQSLSDHYGAYVADTIAAFRDSGRPYEELCDDGTHPNDEGQKVYYETVKPLMDVFYANRNQAKEQIVEAVNQEVAYFENFEYYPADDFRKVDEYTYELEIETSPSMLGIDYTYVKGENLISIYTDGQSICDKQLVWENDYTLRYIEKVADECEIQSKIQIVFSSREQMEAFHGIIITLMI